MALTQTPAGVRTLLWNSSTQTFLGNINTWYSRSIQHECVWLIQKRSFSENGSKSKLNSPPGERAVPFNAEELESSEEVPYIRSLRISSTLLFASIVYCLVIGFLSMKYC